jgi:predicted permease
MQTLEGRPPPANVLELDANFRVVSAGYHRTMGIPLRQGRTFDTRDGAGAPPVVLVNDAFVRQFLGTEAPVGRRMRLGSDEPWMTIVGVVGDVKQMGLDVGSRAEMYVPYRQYADHDLFSPKDLAVRTEREPMSLADSVRKAIWEVDPLQPVAQIRPMAALLDEEVAARNVQAGLLGAFAALALVLAAVGIYGVLSYTVAQRRREIGIRMALGATTPRIVVMVLRYGVRLALLGVAIGLVLAWVATRALSALLYGVSAHEPATYTAVAAAMTLVALFACYFPARQATRVSPLRTLQAD